MRAPHLVAIGLSILLTPLCAESRPWTDSEGREVEGELVSATDETLTLRIGDKEHEMPYAKLSEADQDFVRSWLATRREEMAKSAMEFGGVTLQPGKSTDFKLPFREDGLDHLPKGQEPEYTCRVSLPPGFDPAGDHAIWFVSRSDNKNANQVVKDYSKAKEAGYVVASVDLNEAIFFHHITDLHRLMVQKWPAAKDWPVVCGGNSGGAKKSAYLAAWFTKIEIPLAGIFMGGCNEDRTGDGMEVHKVTGKGKSDYKKIPVFLASGMKDKIATPKDVREVEQSMARTGMKTVRLESYDGGHGTNGGSVLMAAEWFLELAGSQP